jgi:hypothetical protein
LCSVKSFVRDHVSPANGERTEIKYHAWCSKEGCSPIGLSEYLDEIEKVCRQWGVEIEIGDDQFVYCPNVTLGTAGGAHVRCACWRSLTIRRLAVGEPIEMTRKSTRVPALLEVGLPGGFEGLKSGWLLGCQPKCS